MSKEEIVDDWWPLSGQEGEEQEGMVHLILSVQRVAIVKKKASKLNIF